MRGGAGPGGSVLGSVAGFSQELPVTRPRGEPARDEAGAGSKRAHAGPAGSEGCRLACPLLAMTVVTEICWKSV